MRCSVARRDLTEAEIVELQMAYKHMEPRPRELIQRLIGEVLELRGREAAVRQLHDLEQEH